MSIITEQALAARIAITGYVAGAFDRLRSDERGQGSVEYVGIIIVVVAIIAAVIAAVATTDIGTTIMNKIKTAVSSI